MSFSTFRSVRPLGATVLVACIAATGCGRVPLRVAPPPPPEPAPVAATTDDDDSKRAKSAPARSSWADLAAADKGAPLQSIYVGVSTGLRKLGDTWRTSTRPDAKIQRLKVGAELGPLVGLLEETWEKVRKTHPEVGAFEEALAKRARAAGLPEATVPVTFGWLLVEDMVKRLEGADGSDASQASIRDWTLHAIRWSTSSEELYTAAFEVLGPAWTPTKPVPAAGPWSVQGAAAGELAERLAVVSRPLGPNEAVSDVQLVTEGRPGYVALAGFRATDTGGAHAAGNAQVDGSEILELELAFERPGGAGSMISESLVTTTIPPCVVVPKAEIELPEVAKYGVAKVQTEVLVSGRCERDVKVGFEARSSYGDATALSLNVVQRGDVAVQLDLKRDSDLPGWSVAHKATEFLRPGKAIELLPTFTGPARSEARLRRMWFAWEPDSGLATAKFPRFRTATAASSGYTLDDDIDFALVDDKRLTAGIDMRDRNAALAADESALWIGAEFSFQPDAPPPPPPPPTRALFGKSAPNVQTTLAPPPSARLGVAEAWIGERLPAGADFDKVVAHVKSKSEAAVKAAQKLFGEASLFDPDAEAATLAFVALLSDDLLSDVEVRTLLDKFDVPPKVAAEIAGKLMGDNLKAPNAVAALMAHVDARAAARAGAVATTKAPLEDDQARGIGARVAQARTPAKELEQAFEKAMGTKTSTPLDGTARKLARALLVAQVAVNGLSRDEARRVLAQLDLTTLDPLQAPSLVQRAVTIGLLLQVLELERAPDPIMTQALIDYVRSVVPVVAKQAGKSSDRKNPQGEGLPTGAVRVRRWVRLPIGAGGSGDASE
jgi:hypothetical protein